MTDPLLLAVDLGGTKTSAALYAASRGPAKPLAKATFVSADYPDLVALLGGFLADHRQFAPGAASLAVAGPVLGRRATITALGWRLDADELCVAFGLRQAWLMNDLVATARAVPWLKEDDLLTVHGRPASTPGTKGVLAPGTGLGEAALAWDGQRFLALASEGGHADFAPADELQVGLWRFLRRRFGHVSYERACSGRGLPLVYDYLAQRGEQSDRADFAAELASAPDRTVLIVERGLEDPASHPLCAQALELFVRVLGAAAGNLALRLLASGGIYLAGGLPPRLARLIDSELFRSAYGDKGRLSGVVTGIPVHIITRSDAPLFGAAIHGLELLAGGGV